MVLGNLSLLYPHLDLFFKGITFPKKDQTVRPLANISEKLCLAYYKNSKKYVKPPLKAAHKEVLVGASFDWIIADKKSSLPHTRTHITICLYHIGKEIDWIHLELKIILEQKTPTGSAGYKNQAEKIISMITNR
jgi:hypothetical protein